MAKVLVTGASGFIGKHLCSVLNDVIQVVRKPCDSDTVNVVVVPELDDSVDWLNIIPEDVSVIIHLAGVAHTSSVDCGYLRRINQDGTLHLARQAALIGVKRFVFVSSIGVNGVSTSTSPFSFLSQPRPQNDYANSKYNAEVGLRKIEKEMGIDVVIVRPTLVYGQGAPGNFGKLMQFIEKNRLLPFGLVNNRRDFISVQNLVDLLIVCVANPKAAGHTFLASDGKSVSIKEFTNQIAEGLNKRVFQLPIPLCLFRILGKLTGKMPMIEQLIGNLEVDSSNTRMILDWNPPLSMKQSMQLFRHSEGKCDD